MAIFQHIAFPFGFVSKRILRSQKINLSLERLRSNVGIRYRDSNPRPSEHESPHITTRPKLSANWLQLFE